jgi:2'-5' RNA ligase
VVGRTGGKSPRPESIHLTVAFVGDVASDRVAELLRIGETAARAAAPFTLSLDQLGGFRDGGIAWLGAGAVPPDLDQLVRTLNEGLAAQSFRVERRPFKVHVTLARKCRRPPAVEALAPLAWHVDRLTLVASELRPEGSCYRDLAEWPLGAAPR